MDGDAYQYVFATLFSRIIRWWSCEQTLISYASSSSDFLSNLLVLLLRIRNAGLSDGGLLAHLSEATRGSLNGVGHSTAYEDIAAYT